MSIDRHMAIHLRNPNINYIILENCPHCKLERRLQYGNQAFYGNLDNYLIHRTQENHYYSPLVIRGISINEDYHYYENLRDVEVLTSLRALNNNSNLCIYTKYNDLCVICHEYLEYPDIIRKLKCNHFYHSGCADKWFEINRKCPLCQYEIS